MKITILTAGTGSYYCGACMRDNSLARELIAMGHEAHLVPMYLPLQLDEERIDESTPVFFGGSMFTFSRSIAFFVGCLGGWTRFLMVGDYYEWLRNGAI